jgi:hypothetical protein
VMASPQTARDVLRFGAERLLQEQEELRETLLWNPNLPADVHELLKRKPDPQPVAAVTVEGSPAPPEAPSAPLSVPPVEESSNESATGPLIQTTPKPTAEEDAAVILSKLEAGASIEEIAGSAAEVPPEVTKHDEALTPKERETLIEKINRMSVVDKIKAALTGNMETRALLIRDSNKIISRAVLQSPKISDTEAESFAAAKNVSEEVLRLIAMNRKFSKKYGVMRALINNPRAPIDITMPFLVRLNERDLKGLSLNRNVPEVLRSMAIKAIKQREEATKPKLPGKH